MKRKIQCRKFRAGFTLVELMAAMAIALILLIGVGMVFRTAGEVIETGQALGETSRDNRGVYETMSQDFANIADDGPVMTIVNYQFNGYTDQGDFLADVNNPSQSLSPNPMQFDPTHSGNAQQVIPALYNAYSHRMDTISFFARGNYTRQIVINPLNPNSSTSFMDTSPQNSSVEAWITYGLMAMADNTLPGQGTPNYKTPAQGEPGNNPNNAYGVQWTLGRSCILLRTDANLDGNNNYIQAASSGLPLAPLAFGSPDNENPSQPIEAGMADLADTSIAMFTQQVNGQFLRWSWGRTQAASQANPKQDNDTVFGDAYNPDHVFTSLPSNNNPINQSMGFGTGVKPRTFSARNWYAKPLAGSQMSQMAFNLVPGVSQFIVEYAGDYLSQDPATGNVISVYGYGSAFLYGSASAGSGPTDGQIDYIVDTHPDGSKTRRIRWYGLPRDVAGDPNTNLPDAKIPCLGTSGATVPNPQMYIPDVVPLSVLLECGVPIYPERAPFEFPRYDDNNVISNLIPSDYAQSANPMGANGKYCCVFGPYDPKPKLIRITIVLNDPHRRLHDGQTLEYIFNVP